MTIGPEIGIKPLLLPPKLRTLEDSDRRRASYLELFFDLVFVVAIAQLAHKLVIDTRSTFKLWTAQRLLAGMP